MDLKTPDEIFDGRPYGRLLVREKDGGFSAEILEFPGCIAEGDTADEAISQVEETAKAWIESELEQKHTIPEPISGGDYSGRLALRLPRGLHRKLALKAARDRTSINQEVVAAVASWLGADDAYQRIAQRFTQRAVLWMPIVTFATVGTGGPEPSSMQRVGSGPKLLELQLAGSG